MKHMGAAHHHNPESERADCQNKNRFLKAEKIVLVQPIHLFKDSAFKKIQIQRHSGRFTRDRSATSESHPLDLISARVIRTKVGKDAANVVVLNPVQQNLQSFWRMRNSCGA